ncbi:response regulator [Nonomuraea fuscirosea]|jgi:response regulator of citrate/malate metabolism|uniref:Transcriptional regulatory protein n=2 Tax=Nonomuraea TaxID=83681 RepID=A0A2T0M710_9ACTN|nr:response regulator [Nonomuraea fuscirosea]PRX53283.1 response regulator of citrate/malate metabolism [Nonomuraea fuscirosea]WSA57769.1 response regulator [Nonomuraea fuscirosea]
MPEPRDITVLIVDDDPVVTAALHAQVNRVLGFRVVGIAHTGHAALAAAGRFAPRLILLDLHLPDMPGLEVAHRLRRPEQPPADIIVVSSRKESATVRAAIQRGALYYLVKPTRAGTLEQTLLRYAATAEQLDGGGRFAEQQEIDRLFRSLHLDQGTRPKSISPATEQKILDALAEVEEDASAHELAGMVGVSRATARRYLEHLADRGLVEGRPKYGETGRPQHRYRVR